MSFKSTVIVSIEYWQPSFLSTALYIFQTMKLAAIQLKQSPEGVL